MECVVAPAIPDARPARAWIRGTLLGPERKLPRRAVFSAVLRCSRDAFLSRELGGSLAGPYRWTTREGRRHDRRRGAVLGQGACQPPSRPSVDVLRIW